MSKETLYKKQRRAIETYRRPVVATKPGRLEASASEHVCEQANSSGGGARADVLQVGGNSSGGRGRSGSTSCGGRAAGSRSGASGRGRAARGAATGRVAGGVESAAVVLDAGGAVGLALGIANVGGVALGKSLLAGVLRSRVSAKEVNHWAQGKLQRGECRSGGGQLTYSMVLT